MGRLGSGVFGTMGAVKMGAGYKNSAGGIIGLYVTLAPYQKWGI